MHVLTIGDCNFKCLFALSFGRDFWSCSPFDWLAEKLHFHKKVASRFNPFMVALPAGAYVGVACGAIESNRKFSTGFGLSEATRSMTQLLQVTQVVMLEEYCVNIQVSLPHHLVTGSHLPCVDAPPPLCCQSCVLVPTTLEATPCWMILNYSWHEFPKIRNRANDRWEATIMACIPICSTFYVMATKWTYKAFPNGFPHL